MASTFSITAPCFTDAEEQEEREKLTPEERERIEIDAFGKESSSEVKDIDATAARRLVTEAMPSIEPSLKSAYERALKVSLDFVISESDPVHFFRCCGEDPWAAARRLAGYWQARERVFGDKAFLPMTCQLGGALTEEAIQLVKAGLWTRVKDDAMHRAVVYQERALLPSTRTNQVRNSVLQAMFYVLHVASNESKLAQQNGFVILINGKSNVATFDRKLGKQATRILRDEVFPSKIRSFQVCLYQLRPPFTFVLPIFKFLIGKELRLRLFLHPGCGAEIVRSIRKFGFSRDMLPSRVGGDLNVQESHRAWLERRLVHEEEMVARGDDDGVQQVSDSLANVRLQEERRSGIVLS